MKEMKAVRTREVKIFIAGDLAMIKHFCQIYCRQGACVTVTPTEYIYTGGRESGAIIGMIHYARFPREDLSTLDQEIESLAKILLQSLVQRSCTVVTPETTYYIDNPELKDIRR